MVGVPDIMVIRSTQASLARHSSVARRGRGQGVAPKRRSGRYSATGGKWEQVEDDRKQKVWEGARA